MKKFIIFAAAMAVLFSGCSNLTEERTASSNGFSSETTEARSLRSQFKSALEANGKSSAREIISQNEEENSEFLELDDDMSSAEFLLEQGLVSETTAYYITLVENVIDDESLSVEESILNIEKIEMQAKNCLTTEEYETFLNYAEMANAVMDYYSDDTEAQRGIGAWVSGKIKGGLKKVKDNKEKIRKAVISGALGAVVGFVSRAGWIGAFSMGASSAYAAWNSEKISIQLSWTK